MQFLGSLFPDDNSQVIWTDLCRVDVITSRMRARIKSHNLVPGWRTRRIIFRGHTNLHSPCMFRNNNNNNFNWGKMHFPYTFYVFPFIIWTFSTPSTEIATLTSGKSNYLFKCFWKLLYFEKLHDTFVVTIRCTVLKFQRVKFNNWFGHFSNMLQ
jgi:hypothetical protein